MPSRKIFSILIVCMGVIVSVWLLQKHSKAELVTVPSQNKIETEQTLVGKGDIQTGDWQKILVSVAEGTTTVLTHQNNSTDPIDTSVTSQVAKDFMAQYLLLKKNGAPITADQATQIAQNTISNSAYTKATGTVYTSKDVRTTVEVSKETVKSYADAINQSLRTRTPKNEVNELDILSVAVQSKKESDLAKLDPIISGYRGVISDLLATPVPKDAVTLHVTFLNALSNVLANIEAMRQTFSDPVRSFAGVSQYHQHATALGVVLKDLDIYFQSKQ